MIDAILKTDLTAPRKQRHTVKRIYDRLLDEHEAVDVSYQMVRSYVAARREEIRLQACKGVVDAFVPQTHRAGAEAEVDFGDVTVKLAGELVTCYLFAFRLSYSGKAVHRIFASAGQEAFFEGHVHALAQVLGLSRRRIEAERWTAFRSHYGIDALYCQPGIRGAHEKGGVEGQIGWFRATTSSPSLKWTHSPSSSPSPPTTSSCGSADPTTPPRERERRDPSPPARTHREGRHHRRRPGMPHAPAAHFRSQFPDLAETASREQMSYLGFLAELLLDECDDRARRRSERRIKAAGFLRDKSLRKFDFEANPNIDAAMIHTLAKCEWIKKGLPLCLIGDSGTGKSHLLIALGTEAAMAGYRVKYVHVAEFVDAEQVNAGP